MRIQTLKSLVDGNVTTRKGSIVEVEDFTARELIALGYAVHLPEPEESNAAPIAFLAANDNAVDEPFVEAPAGGPGGSVRPVSLSQEAPAPKKRTYKKRAASTKS